MKLTCGTFDVPSCFLVASLSFWRVPPRSREPHEWTMKLGTELQTMIDGVKDGRMDRRGFIQRMIALGLTAPMATQLLAVGGVAMAQTPSSYKPTKRGG